MRCKVLRIPLPFARLQDLASRGAVALRTMSEAHGKRQTHLQNEVVLPPPWYDAVRAGDVDVKVQDSGVRMSREKLMPIKQTSQTESPYRTGMGFQKAPAA